MTTRVCNKCKKEKEENARYFKYIGNGYYKEICKECEGKKRRKNRFLVIKHFRTNQNGCVTATCLVNPSAKSMTVGFSFCSSKDEFCKKKGRKIALERMNESKRIINFETPIAKKVFSYIKTTKNCKEFPNWITKFIKAYEKEFELKQLMKIQSERQPESPLVL